MITYTVKGPKAEALKAASRLMSLHQVEGKIVRRYEDAGNVPEVIPPDTGVVIIVIPEGT